MVCRRRRGLALVGPRRGDVIWVNLDPVVGSEIAKTRPAVVISNDVGNEYSSRVIVAAISSGSAERVYPFEVLLATGEAGLGKSSKVLLDQIRTVDKRRLEGRLGTLSAERMAEVDIAVLRSLGIRVR